MWPQRRWPWPWIALLYWLLSGNQTWQCIFHLYKRDIITVYKLKTSTYGGFPIAMFDCQRVGRMACINDEDSTMVTFGSNISVLPKKRVMCVLLDSIPPKFWGWHQRGWRYLWGRRTHWDVQFQARSKLVPSSFQARSKLQITAVSQASRHTFTQQPGSAWAAWCCLMLGNL